MKTKKISFTALSAVAIGLFLASCGSSTKQIAVSPDGRVSVYAEDGKYQVK